MFMGRIRRFSDAVKKWLGELKLERCEACGAELDIRAVRVLGRDFCGRSCVPAVYRKIQERRVSR